MTRTETFTRNEIPDAAVIQFGHYVDRLLFVTFVRRERNCEFLIFSTIGSWTVALAYLDDFRELLSLC